MFFFMDLLYMTCNLFKTAVRILKMVYFEKLPYFKIIFIFYIQEFRNIFLELCFSTTKCVSFYKQSIMTKSEPLIKHKNRYGPSFLDILENYQGLKNKLFLKKFSSTPMIQPIYKICDSLFQIFFTKNFKWKPI